MAKLDKKFDANKIDPSNTYDIVSAGWYPAQLEKSEIKRTNAGDGSYLSLMFKILDGPSKGRTIFTNLNLDNPNPVAVEIAERNFSALCHAAGVLVVKDTKQLHGKPLAIKVGISPAQGKYEASNDIKGYKAIDDAPDFAKEELGEDNTNTDPPEHTDDDVPDWLKDDE